LSKVQLYDPATQNCEGLVSLLSHFAATPDANRRFVFGKVPPGEFSVFVNSGMGIPFHHQTAFQVFPAETTTVVITNSPGTHVKGRFVAPADQTVTWKQDCTLIHLYAEGRSPQPPNGTIADKRAWALEFWTSAAGREYLSRTHVYSGVAREDGTFVMLDPVAPGRYRFTAVFGRRGERNLSVTRHLTIPDQEGSDLGDLRLE
jgi:hypothetical protein